MAWNNDLNHFDVPLNMIKPRILLFMCVEWSTSSKGVEWVVMLKGPIVSLKSLFIGMWCIDWDIKIGRGRKTLVFVVVISEPIYNNLFLSPICQFRERKIVLKIHLI